MSRETPVAKLLEQALTATRGSRRIAFTREFEPDAPGAWCEIVKDIAAMANSGGGVIVVGLGDDGQPSGWDPDELLRTDPAVVVDELAKYVGDRFDEIELTAAQKGGQRLAAIHVAAREGSPLVFERPGAYRGADGRPHEAFARGTIYFRHRAKSAPALARDIARFASREEARVRRELARNLRRVSSAPVGARVLVVAAEESPATALERVRVVSDPSAPAVARADYDATHPHRQKDVIAAVNARLGGSVINAHDVLCVRRAHGVDEAEDLSHQPRFGSRQYSDAFIDWLVTSFEGDDSFFEDAKSEYRRRRMDGRR